MISQLKYIIFFYQSWARKNVANENILYKSLQPAVYFNDVVKLPSTGPQRQPTAKTMNHQRRLTLIIFSLLEEKSKLTSLLKWALSGAFFGFISVDYLCFFCGHSLEPKRGILIIHRLKFAINCWTSPRKHSCLFLCY